VTLQMRPRAPDLSLTSLSVNISHKEVFCVIRGLCQIRRSVGETELAGASDVDES
jgi:hypothetical protein